MNMFVLICYTINFFMGAVGIFVQKKYQLIRPEGKNSYNFYAIITAIVSMINYGIMINFAPGPYDYRVLILALIFAVSCCGGYVFSLKSFEKNGVFLTSVSGRIGSIVMPMLVTVTFLNENINISTVAGAACTLLASFVLVYGKETACNINIPLLLGNIVINSVGVTCTKIFVKINAAENIVSFYYLVNLFILIISAICFFISFDKKNIKESIGQFKFRHYFMVFAKATLDALAVYVSRYILARVDVITNTVVSTSLGMISTLLVSYILAEKLGFRHFISILLTVAAAAIPLVFL